MAPADRAGTAEEFDGRPVAAEEHYRRALSMHSRDAWLPVAAARGTPWRAGRAESADASEDSVRVLLRLALERFRLGLALAPQNPSALAGSVLSRLMLDIPVDSTEVLRLEQAAAAAPSRADLGAAIAAVRRARALRRPGA